VSTGNPTGKTLRVRVRVDTTRRVRARCHIDLCMVWYSGVKAKDENGTEISRTDRFRFLYYDSVFKHKMLLVSIDFTTIFNHFLYSLIAKM
jgi:hypothetical protein